jgi:hypothetical protein
MTAAMMDIENKAHTDRNAALNKLRWALDQAAREFETTTGQRIARLEIYRKGHDWMIDAHTINAVAAHDGKVFV